MTALIQEIPLSNLVASSRNVRRTAPKSGIEELAASISAHGLLQNLTVVPAEDGSGRKKKAFEVIAGGRRLAALKLLAKRKLVAKDALVPCHVRDADTAEELSLAENALQCPMHPADQFEAFARLHDEKGMSADDIGARFGVSANVVRQRLSLGRVSPKLMAIYRKGDMNLAQLTAFAISDDHRRQEQVWKALPNYNRSREAILDRLNEGSVAISDRCARFVGTETYEAAGGAILRDLFDEEGGYLADPELLDRLVREKLQAEADQIAAEGWRWVEIIPAFDYQATADMRRLYPKPVAFSHEEQARLEALESEYEALGVACCDEVSDADAAEFERLEAAISELTGRESFEAADTARAGVFVALAADGTPRVERGFIRPEHDDRKAEPRSKKAEREGPSPLAEKLVTELTSHRTAALRDRLAQAPQTALRAVAHALALEAFYFGAGDASCLEITMRSRSLGSQPGFAESPAATAITARHEGWAKRLSDDPSALWDFVLALEESVLLELVAHSASLTLNAVQAPGSKGLAASVHGDALAHALSLDMTAYWRPTAENYFGRISKERILAAVKEGISPSAAENLAKLKKPAMAEAAETRLAASGWLPELLRAPATAQAPQRPTTTARADRPAESASP